MLILIMLITLILILHAMIQENINYPGNLPNKRGIIHVNPSKDALPKLMIINKLIPLILMIKIMDNIAKITSVTILATMISNRNKTYSIITTLKTKAYSMIFKTDAEILIKKFKNTTES